MNCLFFLEKSSKSVLVDIAWSLIENRNNETKELQQLLQENSRLKEENKRLTDDLDKRASEVYQKKNENLELQDTINN